MSKIYDFKTGRPIKQDDYHSATDYWLDYLGLDRKDLSKLDLDDLEEIIKETNKSWRPM